MRKFAQYATCESPESVWIRKFLKEYPGTDRGKLENALEKLPKRLRAFVEKEKDGSTYVYLETKTGLSKAIASRWAQGCCSTPELRTIGKVAKYKGMSIPEYIFSDDE